MLRALPAHGALRVSAEDKLYRFALESREPGLIEIAAKRLAAKSRLSLEQEGTLRLLLLDPEVEVEARQHAFVSLRKQLDVKSLLELTDDDELLLSEQAMLLLSERSMPQLAPYRRTLQALAMRLGAEAPNARNRILRFGYLAVLARSGDGSVREALVQGIDDPLFKVRWWVATGLGSLASAGDVASASRLRRWNRHEPDARIRAHIESRLNAESEHRQTAEEASHLGLRMVLVLAGLASLAAMVLLPSLRSREKSSRR